MFNNRQEPEGTDFILAMEHAVRISSPPGLPSIHEFYCADVLVDLATSPRIFLFLDCDYYFCVSFHILGLVPTSFVLSARSNHVLLTSGLFRCNNWRLRPQAYSRRRTPTALHCVFSSLCMRVVVARHTQATARKPLFCCRCEVSNPLARARPVTLCNRPR